MATLPDELRGWLEAELVRRGFGGYAEVTRALNDRIAEAGLEISVSKRVVHLYGQQVEERISALKRTTEIARTLTREVGDDEGAINDALMRLLQDKLFRVVLDLEIDPDDIDVHKIGKTIADLGRASIAQKKHQADVRARAIAVAESVATEAKSGGLSDAAAEDIRRKILGIAA